MKLAELLQAVPEARIQGPVEVEIAGLCYDSRLVRPADLFFAWQGEKTDGHRYIPQALERGALAVVGEFSGTIPGFVSTLIQVPRPREALARMADLFHDHPSRKMQTIGVTGTNGKTTTAFLIKFLLSQLGAKVGLLGTVRYEIGGRTLPASRTTPEGSDLQLLLEQMQAEQCQAVVMEVSSHALAQGRVAGVDFQAAAWTNLTPDHLDYHQTMEGYFAAKKLLFDQLSLSSRAPVAVMNLDASYAAELGTQLDPALRVIGFSLQGQPSAALQADTIRFSPSGTTFNLRWDGQSYSVEVPLVGRYNVENVLAALAVVLGLGYPLHLLLPWLSALPNVPGRLEKILTPNGVTVFVDYAHTPDAVENVLLTLRELAPQRLITVVGCGGNRDRTKRPLMAAAAVRLSDLVIFTADNPRHERIEDIFADMHAGVLANQSVQWISDRREAIQSAILGARPGDVVCLAGKGHETTQEVAGVFLPFDDREVVSEILLRRTN